MMHHKKSGLHMTAWVLVIIGALNWGLVGIGNFIGGMYSWDVVDLILGGISWLANIIYILVGLSALVLLFGKKMGGGKKGGMQAPSGGNMGEQSGGSDMGSN